MSGWLDDLQKRLLERRLDVASVARAAHGEKALVVAVDGPFDTNYRVGVFAEHGDRIDLVADGIADLAGIDALIAALGGRATKGEWDAAWAMAPHYVWVREPARVWTGDGEPFARVDGDRLVTRGGTFPKAELEGVTAYVSSDWGEIGVRLDLRGGPHVLATTDNSWAHVDPTYDGLNLMVDAAWARSLARLLAGPLGVPWNDAT